MSIAPRLETALGSAEPMNDLRALVDELFSEGYGAERLLQTLEKFREQLRMADRDSDEDTILELMDFVAGWCSPHVKLPSHKTG